MSTRVAEQFPTLKESKIVASYSTPWPKQLYSITEGATSDKYNSLHASLADSANVLLMFFVGSLIAVPPYIQDMLIHMVTTCTIGYASWLHIRLFVIYPALVLLPTLVIGSAVYVLVFVGKDRAAVKVKGKRTAVAPAPSSAS